MHYLLFILLGFMFDFLETHFLGLMAIADCKLVGQPPSGLHFTDDSGRIPLAE
jgi:hypothetical protein